MSKNDHRTDDNFQRIGKSETRRQVTDAMPEIGTSVGDELTKDNYLDN